MRVAKKLPMDLNSYATRAEGAHATPVTLVVYAWDNVEPGTLAWVFGEVESAVQAARTMRNAVRWCVVEGERTAASFNLDRERKGGTLLVDQS